MIKTAFAAIGIGAIIASAWVAVGVFIEAITRNGATRRSDEVSNRMQWTTVFFYWWVANATCAFVVLLMIERGY